MKGTVVQQESDRLPEHPEISSWAAENGGGLDYLDYAAQRLRLPEWVSLAHCFRPRFIEVSGCVIWDRAYEAGNFSEWHARLAGDSQTLEATLNQFQLWQFIDMDDATPEEEAQLRGLADDIAFCWRACLESDFPGKEFDGGVVDTEDGPVVRFFARRDP